MILSVESAKELIEFKGWTDAKIERKLKAMEQTIRAYTNNNFQNCNIRGYFAVTDTGLQGDTTGFSVGDTIQISESKYNGGLHVIAAAYGDSISVDTENMIPESAVLVTKIEYPADVVDCCVNLLEWEVKNREKVGIKSETLSRHSTTYYDQDSNNQVMGYPVSLLGCLRAYRKCRC